MSIKIKNMLTLHIPAQLLRYRIRVPFIFEPQLGFFCFKIMKKLKQISKIVYP